MFTTTVVLVWLAVLPLQEPGTPKVPNESSEVSARGCLKGRVFAAGVRTEDEGVQLGPDISGRSFRVSAKKDVMSDVKKYNGQWVEVRGIIKKSDLADYMLGTKLGGARVVIGQPGRDPMRTNLPAPQAVPVMDVTAVRFLDETCPIR
jgi:hypothetical protein